MHTLGLIIIVVFQHLRFARIILQLILQLVQLWCVESRSGDLCTCFFQTLASRISKKLAGNVRGNASIDPTLEETDCNLANRCLNLDDE